MKNKKSLGQNWLTDSAMLKSIASLAELNAGATVLEVGPGLGYLTDKLLDTGANVVALEFDQDLIPKLQAKYKTAKNKPQVIEGDIRTFDLEKLPNNYAICANIPYYLTANLLRKLTDEDHKPQKAVLLVQKEVAEKLAAKHKRSMLNVLVGYWYSASLGPVAPASMFVPPPKVDSQAIVLTRRAKPLLAPTNWPAFVALVKMAYSSPRKKLRANLAAGTAKTKQEIDELLSSISIDPNARAEQLNDDDWQNLVGCLH